MKKILIALGFFAAFVIGRGYVRFNAAGAANGDVVKAVLWDGANKFGTSANPLFATLTGSSSVTLSGTGTVTQTPNPTTTKETLHGSATSPMGCAAANVTLLDAATRSGGSLQNEGTADVCLCFNTATCPVPGAAGCEYVLKKPTANHGGDGGLYFIGGNSGKTIAGIVSCGGAAGGSVNVHSEP